MSWADINRIRDKYAWYTLGEQLALVEKLSNGSWGSVTESTHTIRAHVTKLPDPLTIDDTIAESGLNLITNGDFEIGTGGDFSSWEETGTLVTDTVTFNGGLQSCGFTEVDDEINQTIALTAGSTYRLKWYGRGDGTGTHSATVVGLTSGDDIAYRDDTVGAASWIQYYLDFTVPDGETHCKIVFTNLTVDCNIDDVELYATTVHNHLQEQPEFPSQFHMSIVNKVIAELYKVNRNKDLELAQYYELEYMKDIKAARKYSKSKHISSGFIVPRDF